MYTVKENSKNLYRNNVFQHNLYFDILEAEEEKDIMKGIIEVEDSEYIKNMKNRFQDIC